MCRVCHGPPPGHLQQTVTNLTRPLLEHAGNGSHDHARNQDGNVVPKIKLDNTLDPRGDWLFRVNWDVSAHVGIIHPGTALGSRWPSAPSLLFVARSRGVVRLKEAICYGPGNPYEQKKEDASTK